MRQGARPQRLAQRQPAGPVMVRDELEPDAQERPRHERSGPKCVLPTRPKPKRQSELLGRALLPVLR
eukprot:5227399-Alexandrium_andersonii.AAC.1